MTTFARGVAKTVTINPETSFGIVGAGTGQLLRRTSSDLNLSVAQVQSQEILQSQQVRDQRNGPRQVQGTLAGQLSPSTYSMLFEGLLRSTFAPVMPLVNFTDTAATLDGNQNVVVTTSGGNFAQRFRNGDMLRVSGLIGASAVNNFDDARVIAVSAGSMTLSVPKGSAAWTTGQTNTFTLPGKKLFIPATGQLNKSFSLEHWYSDIGESELFLGCKVTQISLNIPASGFVTVQASVSGQDMNKTTVQAFPAPAPLSSTTGLTATTGKVSYNGAAIAYISAMSVQIVSSVGNDPVVGSNIVPEIFLGTLMVRGSISAMTTSDSLTADFLNENEVSLSVLMTTGPADNAEFMSIHMPRVKLISSTKNDSDKAIMRSFNFVALENTGSASGHDLTSIVVQDSQTP